MATNSLDWQIFAADESYSVYCDDPAEGYWFRDFADADQFRRALVNDPNIDPQMAFSCWNPANS